jgi:hypothetical protein
MKRILLGLVFLSTAAQAANDVVPANPPTAPASTAPATATPPTPQATPATPQAIPAPVAKTNGAPASVLGKWSGPVTQVGSDDGYWVNLTLTATGGTSYYPELSCGGTLKKVGESNGYTFYAETITTNRDSCMDGSITVSRIKGGLGWNWFGAKDENIYVAYSSLAESK